MKFAVIGHPVAHSLSPAMHQAAFRSRGIDATFEAIDVKPQELGEALGRLSASDYRGVSVTVPHKEATLGWCTEVSPMAKSIGAVNCIALSAPGRLVGHNTDAPGFVAALMAERVFVDGKRVTLLGAGGAARAIAVGLEHSGAAVEVVARRPDEVRWAAAHRWAALEDILPHTDLLVDCTPTGLQKGADLAFAAMVPWQQLPKRAVVATLVYHRWPALLVQAAAAGHRVVDGAGMLAYQGAMAWTHWGLGRPDVKEMLATIRSAAAARETPA